MPDPSEEVTAKEVIPRAYRPTVSFSAEELKELQTKVRTWQKDPGARRAELVETSWMTLLILKKMATTEIAGRSGPRIQMAAAKDFVKMTAEVMKIEKAQRLLTMKACPHCGTSLEELAGVEETEEEEGEEKSPSPPKSPSKRRKKA